MSSKVNIGIFLLFNATMAFAVPVNNNIPVDKFNASLGLAVENTNNVFLSGTNKKSDNIFHEIFAANYTRNSPTVQTQFSLNADHLHYQNNSFPDQNVFSALLGLNTILVKNRLTWNINDRFQRVPINVSVLNLPSNQENVNYFNTGPSLVVLRNDRQSLNLNLSYFRTYSQKSEINSSGSTAEAVYSRNLTRTFTVKLNLHRKVVNFVNTTANTNYTRTDGTVTFSKQMKLSRLDLTGGRSKIDREGASSIDNGIFRADYNYQLGQKAGLKINYDRELGDFTGVYSNIVSSSPQGLPSVGSEIFLMKRGGVSIHNNFGYSSIAYNYTYFTTDYYSNQALNTTSKMSELSYTHKLSAALIFGLSGTYQIDTYNNAARRDTSEIYLGSLSKKIAGAYDLAVKFQYRNNNSNVPTYIYDEKRVTISGNYYF